MKNPHYISTVFSLFKKELMSYFNSPIAYIFIGIFLVVGNWLFFSPFFLAGQASLRSYFMLLPWVLLFLAPAITMRLWSEEKQSGTIEFLLTLPVTNWQVVWAKFLSAFIFMFLSLLLSLTLPITVSYLGDLDVGPVIGGYVGGGLLGAAYLALGLFISSLTRNQIIAFIVALAVCFGLFMLSSEMVLISLPQWLANIVNSLGVGSHFYNLARGVIDTKDIIYYFSFTGLFLWLNVKVLELRNWR